MADENSVLVAIMNNERDFNIALDEHWYRIPVEQAHKRGKHHWPPQWLAFYQTRDFPKEACAVNYYAHVHEVRLTHRRELSPDELENEKSDKLYYQLMLSPLQALSRPVVSLRWRRITFIPTIWHKLQAAEEINDLWDESPLEDELWKGLKRKRLRAERQEFVAIRKRLYAFDFVLYCPGGRLNVETDGDSWHSNPKRIAEDNRRDNALVAEGWRLLRFSTMQIREQMDDYCLPTIVEVVERMGGQAGGANSSRG